MQSYGIIIISPNFFKKNFHNQPTIYLLTKLHLIIIREKNDKKFGSY